MFVSFGDEESCPFSFNKQTAVRINNLHVLGLRASENSVLCHSFCLPFLRTGRGSAPSQSCFGQDQAHNGHIFCVPTFVFQLTVMCVRLTVSLCIFVMSHVSTVGGGPPGLSQKANTMRKSEPTPCGTAVSVSQALYWLVRRPNSSGVMKLGGGCQQRACLFSWISTPLAFGWCVPQ